MIEEILMRSTLHPNDCLTSRAGGIMSSTASIAPPGMACIRCDKSTAGPISSDNKWAMILEIIDGHEATHALKA
jgi:hypothetical protein